MDYTSWSRCEAVPLSNGIVARRTGLHYMKTPEEISAYYRQQFGTYWFDELPKTDNTYSPTSKYYGCTLAPGIPLIPNLCRRPLRSPSGKEYDYTFTSDNHHNNWVESNNLTNKKHDNGHSFNHGGQTELPRRRVEFVSRLDSDSDLDETDNHSQNTVTWISWLITVVTTMTTIVTETITQKHQNHVNTRVPLKHHGGVVWYQYPVMWLYKMALLVQRLDVWLLCKVNSVLRVDSWGNSQQRRKWALIILLIPLILWAGYKLVEWLWDETASSEGISLTALLLDPLLTAWDSVTTWFSATWGWFDGSWLWAPWVTVAGWWAESSAAVDTPAVVEEVVDEEATTFVDWDWSGLFDGPCESVAALFASTTAVFASAASSLGDGAAVVYASVASAIYTLFAWLVDCVTSIPALLSTAFALVAYPFKSISWESASPVDYTPAPAAPIPAPVYYSTPSPAPAPASDPSSSLDLLLQDKQLLALLVRGLLSSEEFDRAMAKRASNNQQQVDLAVDSAFSAALYKINQEFKRVRDELNDKIVTEESSVEAKMEGLKRQILDLQMALKAHKAMVSEQAAFGSLLEERLSTTEQSKDEENNKIKDQILLEISRVKGEIVEELLNFQVNQQVVVESGTKTSTTITPSSELEAFVNSTVERLLSVYDADKIAKVDYALASSGGAVLSTKCTETYSKKNAQYLVWGYPFWSRAPNDPKIALEPSINAGECWAFSGTRGYLVIELSENIYVTGFTLEHLPRSLSPSGSIDTAPRDFQVLGMDSEQDETPLVLGEFRYEDNGASLQTFQARSVDHPFKIVQLVIESNHGNLEYTCLYRFRVHGRPVRS